MTIEFIGRRCGTAGTIVPGLYQFREYLQTSREPYECDTPIITTERGHLNHIEIYLTAHHLAITNRVLTEAPLDASQNMFAARNPDPIGPHCPSGGECDSRSE